MNNEILGMRGDQYVNGLKDLIKYINSNSLTNEMVMIEIGAYTGESTIIFSEQFKDVITIDPYIDDYDEKDLICSYAPLQMVYEKFIEKTKSINNIRLIRKKSDSAFEDLKEMKFDFIYIDGVHTYEQVKIDITNYIQLVKPGGFIGGHDYSNEFAGVMNAVNENFSQLDGIFSDNSWIKKL